MINLIQGAFAAAYLQSRQLPTNTVISGAALSSALPGIVGLLTPLLLARNSAAAGSPGSGLPGSGSPGGAVAVTSVPALLRVPDLTGMTEADARKALAGKFVPDLRVGQLEGGGAAGVVIDQGRPAGALAPQGASLVVYLQAHNDFGEDSVDMQ